MAQEHQKNPVPVFIFMGTCGCGKSSIAAACKKIVNCELIEGDDLHPKANVDKMSKGKRVLHCGHKRLYKFKGMTGSYRDVGYTMSYTCIQLLTDLLAGIPLQDEDRWSWLESIRDTFTKKALAIYEDPKVDEKSSNRAVFVTCSALRKVYRDILSKVDSAKVTVTFVYLKGSPELLQSRMAGRSNHFMHENMLKSQLATLEEPDEETENAIVARIDPTTDEIAKYIINAAKERKLIYID
jgi:gluconokinase